MTRTEHLLAILSEECSEVAQRVSKALRFGLEEIQPEQHLTNAERIVVELDDLVGTYEILRREGLLPDLNEAAQAKKRAKIEQFLKYSETMGTLSS